MASKSSPLLSVWRTLGISPLLLVGVAGAALWAFGVSVPRDGGRERLQTDHPLAKGGTLWDSVPNAAARPPAPRPAQDAQETQVLLQDWEYTSFPISHWRR